MEPYIGEIKMFAGPYAPRDYLFCDGSILPISDYQALFAVLGVTYGGDGRSTFALPNLEARVPLQFGYPPGGMANYVIGETGGTIAAGLSEAMLPAHRHQMKVAQEGVTGTPADDTSVAPPPATRRSAGPSIFHDADNLVPLSTYSLMNTGGGQYHENRQPYQVINFIIATDGVFPSRN